MNNRAKTLAILAC